MRKQVIIEQSVVLTRIALMIDGECKQIYAEQVFQPSGQSKVVQGQIEKIVPHLKAAFVNYGEEKNGLLHMSKIPPCYENRVQQGLRLPVQVVKENTGGKGHKLSAYINIPGYYLVCLPFESSISISKKIADPQKRGELKKMIEQLRGDYPYGFIVRTNSQDASRETLEMEIQQLIAEANKLMLYKDTLTRGEVLMEDHPLSIHLLREWIRPQDDVEVLSNDETILSQISKHMTGFLPDVKVVYKSYPKEEMLFSIFSIEKLFDSALKKKVWLKNGGNLVVESTEALTVVDVNSAKAIEKKNATKATKELNQLAITETLKQIVFRNLSGIVIVDLIDIKTRELREELYEFARQQANSIDGSRTRVFPISELDLLQLSREKKYQKLSEVILEPCQKCGALGGQSGVCYQTFKIEQKIKGIAAQTIQKEVYLECGTLLAKYWEDHGLVAAYKAHYGLMIHLTSNSHSEKYTLNYHI